MPYTGSGVLGSALTLDKIRTKQVWLGARVVDAALRSPRARRQDVEQAALKIGLPVIVKPSLEGSSVGVSRVFETADLPQAIELAERYPGELLMEQLIVGGEYTVAILGDEALPSIRIVPAGEYYDYHAKYVARGHAVPVPGADRRGGKGDRARWHSRIPCRRLRGAGGAST